MRYKTLSKSTRQLREFQKRFGDRGKVFNTRFDVEKVDKEQGIILASNGVEAIELIVDKASLSKITTDMYIIVSPSAKTRSHLHFKL